jgi:hypothetical protein
VCDIDRPGSPKPRRWNNRHADAGPSRNEQAERLPMIITGMVDIVSITKLPRLARLRCSPLLVPIMMIFGGMN